MENQNLSILIVEDDFSFSIELEMMVKEIGYNVLATVDNSAEALENIYSNQPDMILMDVDIKGQLTGIELAEKTKHLGIPILFITSYKQQNIYDRAKRTNFVGYMVKPLEEYSLRSAIDLAVKSLNLNKGAQKEKTATISLNGDLFFKKKGVFKKVNVEQIYFIEAKGNYSRAVTSNDKLVTSNTLSELESLLNDYHFMRIHRGYLINLKKISYLDTTNNKVIVGNYTIPISRGKKAELVQVIQLLQ